MESSCPRLSECAFFRSSFAGRRAVTAELLKDKYCHGNFEACARRRVGRRFGPDAVPDDMLPNAFHTMETIFQQRSST